MSRKKLSNLEVLETEKRLTGKQDWEVDTKMTEKEKRNWYQDHVAQTQAGSSNMRKKNSLVVRFEQTQEDIERSKYQDHLGNPLPGYKWGKNGKIVIDVKYREKKENQSKGTFSIVKSENRVL